MKYLLVAWICLGHVPMLLEAALQERFTKVRLTKRDGLLEGTSISDGSLFSDKTLTAQSIRKRRCESISSMGWSDDDSEPTTIFQIAEKYREAIEFKVQLKNFLEELSGLLCIEGQSPTQTALETLIVDKKSMIAACSRDQIELLKQMQVHIVRELATLEPTDVS